MDRLLSGLATLLLVVTGLSSCGARAVSSVELERIGQVLGLEAGMVVADVGAGSGRWAADLAARVGPRGRVFATEVDRGDLERIRDRAESSGHENLVPVLGSQSATGLGAGCCQAILLRLVYHHFTEPARMRDDLWRALRPGGRIAVIETKPQSGWRRLDGVPERGGHGIDPVELERDMLAQGFLVASRHDPWPGGEGEPYCIVFERPPERRAEDP